MIKEKETAPFKIEIDRNSIKRQIDECIHGMVREKLEAQKADISKSIEQFFNKGFFSEEKTGLDNALEYIIEASFRDGLQLAINEMGLVKIISDQAKLILNNPDLIEELAMKAINNSFDINK